MLSNEIGDGAEGQLILNVSETLRDCAAWGLLAVNHEGIVTAFCPEAERLLQVRAAKVLAQPANSLPSPLPDLIQEAASKGSKGLVRPMVVQQDGKAKRQVQAEAVVVSFDRESAPGVLVVFKDLDATHKLENHMRRLDRLASIGALSASMAHEVKNALVPIKTFVDLLRKDNPDAELSQLAFNELARVESLIGQMLRFAGPGRPSLHPIHINTVLDQAVCLIQHQVEAKQIQLERRYAAGNDLVAADTYQLEQAFLNVLLNAIEAMNLGGSLTVETMIEKSSDAPEMGDRLRVVIRDTGIGIEPQNMKRLFETFFTTKPHGTGLGLAITRRIIHEHRGIITLDSSLHQGTSVSIELPLEPGPGPGPCLALKQPSDE
jgi:signal transduction histidine kinase